MTKDNSFFEEHKKTLTDLHKCSVTLGQDNEREEREGVSEVGVLLEAAIESILIERCAPYMVMLCSENRAQT